MGQSTVPLGPAAALPRSPALARPLSATGRREAAGLLVQLAAYPIRAIRSSPALRCRQTVQPLADQRGLPVATDELLAVDAEVDQVPARLVAVGADEDEMVWCTHGELIGMPLLRLRAGGAPSSRRAVWPKGSTWLLEPAGGVIRRATYLPPRRARRLAAPADGSAGADQRWRW